VCKCKDAIFSKVTVYVGNYITNFRNEIIGLLINYKNKIEYVFYLILFL